MAKSRNTRMAKSAAARFAAAKSKAELRRAQTEPRPAEAGALPPPADDDPVPKDINEFRLALARRILTFLGMSRRCRAPGCRRARRCVGPDLRCQRDNPLPKLSPERQAAMKAALQRALKRRLAQGGQAPQA